MEVNFKGEGLYNAARMSPAIFCNDELTNGQIDAHHLKKITFALLPDEKCQLGNNATLTLIGWSNMGHLERLTAP